MAKRLYVGGLPAATVDRDLEKLFAPSGTVTSATVISDLNTGHCKGYGYVEMKTDAQANAAILALNRTQWRGWELTVNEATPRRERLRSGGYGYGR